MEYGAPHATYKARGLVVSEADNSPIEGIKASFFRKYNYIDYEDEDEDEIFYGTPKATTFTNSNGIFFLEARYANGSKFYIDLLDVDGELNGSFERKIIEVDYSNEKFKGSDGNWYKGEAEINLGTIKMKPE